MKNFYFLIASLFITIGTMAQPYVGKKRMTAEELNAVTERTPILIRCTQITNYNTYYNHEDGRTGDTNKQLTYYWVPVEDGVAGTYYIMKGESDSDYLQTTDIKTYGTKDSAAKFYAVKPYVGGTAPENFNGDNIYEDAATGGDYYVRLAFKDNSKWFNLTTSGYNTGNGVWTVQNVYDMSEEEVAIPEENTLETGKYYRIKGVTGNYITANNETGGQAMAMLADKSSKNILYFNEDRKLLVYGTGLYVNGPNHALMGYSGTFKIYESILGTEGKYTIKASGNLGGADYNEYLSGSGTNLAKTATVNENCDFEIEEVASLPVTIGDALYATFYAPVEVTIPDGVEAYYVTASGIKSDNVILTKIENGVVPANTGVILSAAKGDYDLDITLTDAVPVADNLLNGTVNKANITADAYVLGFVDGVAGLYIATKNQSGNTAFISNSHKAYLPASAVPAAVQGAANFSFRFGEGTTGIDEITDNRVQSTVIYDLTGRRVEAITAPGIYVVNGKKVLVK